MTKTIAYKGFNADWTCRGFQFEVGKTYEHEGEVEVCGAGFHACTHPLDTFAYYEPSRSKYALVEMSGETDREQGSDTKLAAARIEIKAELHLGELIEAAVKHVFDAAKWVKGSTVKKDQGAASATGYQGAASATGYQGAASATGDWGAASATGDRGAASATGDRGAASATGNWGAASATGDQGAASATGYQGAASATGDWGAASATGDRGAASATGDRGAASATGNWGAASATGDQGAAMASGPNGRVKGETGCMIALSEFNDAYERIAAWAGVVGQNGIKPDTWYELRNGKPVEVTE